MEKPTFKQRVDSFLNFIWNSEEKKVLGRGGRSWAEIGLFYLIYYTCLAAFFAATLAVFYETVDNDSPKLKGTDSLLKGNPGMGYQPMPNIETTLVRTTRSPQLAKHIKGMKESYEKVLDEYQKTFNSTAECGSIRTPQHESTTACKVDFEALTENCNAGNGYGMDVDKPCILLKLNRIYGWVPDVWETSEEAKKAGLPEEITDKYDNDRIWVYCHGENPADNDNIGLGQINYKPIQGFPLSYYPYRKQENYRSPLVFVQFENATKHIGLMVECIAYAKNIEVDAVEKEGSVHFELLNEPTLNTDPSS